MSNEFDAPRPAVTNRLGKKRTDKLIRADGDTWQEYLSVCEKGRIEKGRPEKGRRAAAFSLFGKKKKMTSIETNTNTNGNDNDNSKGNGNDISNLMIRSYFQNTRTKKKVWDEPPSGASHIVPASEEMRLMAQHQLGELYVATTTPYVTEAFDGGFMNRGEMESIYNNRAMCETAELNPARRIQYKPNSNVLTAGNGEDPQSGGGGGSLYDQQIQQAINQSMVESNRGGSDRTITTSNFEDEDEILRRVLEESRIESLRSTAAALSPKTPANSRNNGDLYSVRIETPRKDPPTEIDPSREQRLRFVTQTKPQIDRRAQMQKVPESESESSNSSESNVWGEEQTFTNPKPPKLSSRSFRGRAPSVGRRVKAIGGQRNEKPSSSLSFRGLAPGRKKKAW